MQKNKGIFSLWTTLLSALLLAACLSLAGSGVALAAANGVTITGDGVNNPVTITQTELEALGSEEIVTYSSINTWPSKSWYIGQGAKLRDLLNLAGLKENATLIKFTGSGEYTATFTVEELLGTDRYCFPNFMNAGVQGYLFDENSASGGILVEPILAYRSAISLNQADLSSSNANLLLFGQRTVTEQTNIYFVKEVSTIEVLTTPLSKWDKPKASPAAGEVVKGTMVELQFSGSWDMEKIHYTLDGNTPDIDSPIYNWIAYRWLSSREEVDTINKKIGPINEDTTIKAIVTGFGKQDSDVVTFSYTILPWPADSQITLGLEWDTVTLSWPAADGSFTHYWIYDGDVLLDAVDSGVLSYTVSGLSEGRNYSFKIKTGSATSSSEATHLSRTIYLVPAASNPDHPLEIRDTGFYVPVQPATDDSDHITSAALPQITLQANTSLSTTTPVQVEIPAGTRISGSTSWDGLIQAPVATDATIDSNIGTVNAAVEVGYSGGTLNFDKAVKLVIPGQAGKKAGYIDSDGTWHAISTDVTGTDSAAVTTELTGKGVREGYQDAGDNLVIWTMHFTKFVAYTPPTTTTSPPSGGGGGGGGGGTDQWVTSTTGKATLKPSAGGSVSLGSEATIEVPAKALNGSSSLEVRVEKVSSPPAVPDSLRLLSNVYEFSVGGKKGYDFAKDVTISISFDSSALGAGETAAVYYCDETDKQWVELSGSVSGDTAGTMVDHFTKFAVLAAASEETNNTEVSTGTSAPAENEEALTDITGHWAQANISKLVQQGNISGYPDGTFQPDNSITRAEFAAILVKAFNLTGQEGKVFADTADHWAKDYIAAAAANGIVGGYDADTFGPDDLITREQMAVMIVKAAKLTPAAGQESSLADNGAISAWAADAVAAAVQNSLMNGYPDGSFQPQGQATRAEAVTVVVNAL